MVIGMMGRWMEDSEELWDSEKGCYTGYNGWLMMMGVSIAMGVPPMDDF